jgi:hypothetical protein
VVIPHGAAIDNLATATWEFGFRWGGQHTSAWPLLYDKKQNTAGANLGVLIYYDIAGGRINIERKEDSTHHRTYSFVTTFVTGNWYDVQITWDMSNHANVPVCHVNGVNCTATDVSSAGTTWADDSGNNATLGRRGDDTANDTKWLLTMFRLHNAALSSAYLDDNYAADRARWYRANCQVEYDWSEASTTQTNDGIAGSSYNGTITNASDISTASSGAKVLAINDDSDYARVPKGAVVDTPTLHSFEFLFYYNADTHDGARVYDKYSKYIVAIDTTNHILNVLRYDDGGTAYKLYGTQNNAFPAAGMYHVVIAWDASNTANAPNVYLNGTLQTLVTGHSGTTDVWYADSADNGYISNTSARLNANWYLFRFHNTQLSAGDVTHSYNTESWRYTTVNATYTQTTVPTTTSASVSPTPSILQNREYTESTIPNATSVPVAPAVVRICNPTYTEATVPNTTSTSIPPVVEPTSSPSYEQTTVPTSTTTVPAVVPSLICNPTYTQSTVPTTASASVSPAASMGSDYIESTVPTTESAVNEVAPSIVQDREYIETTIPDTTTAVTEITPNIFEIDPTYVQFKIPNATAKTHLVVPFVAESNPEYTLETVPNSTAEVPNVEAVVEQDKEYTQATVPTTTSAAARTPHEDACQVKFSTWPTTGVTITNEGRAGGAYNATAADNDYYLLPSGATEFLFDTNTDYISIPHGPAIDNLGAHTLEFGIYYADNRTGGTFLFGKRGDVFLVAISSGGNRFLIYRFDDGGVAYKSWAGDYPFSAANVYHIQVAWDATNVANDPIVKINNEVLTLTAYDSGVTDAYYNDSANNLTIGNYSDDAEGIYSLNGGLFLFRLHNRVLTDTELSDNYYADVGLEVVIEATTSPTYTPTVPDATAETPAVEISLFSNPAYVQTVVSSTVTEVPVIIPGCDSNDYTQVDIPNVTTSVPLVTTLIFTIPPTPTIIPEPPARPEVVSRLPHSTRTQLVDAEHRIIIRNSELEDIGEITRFTKWQHTLKLNEVSSWQLDMHTQDFESYDIDENTGILFYRDDELLIDGPIMPNGIMHTSSGGIENTTIVGGCDLAYLRGRICYPVVTGPLFDTTVGNWRFGVQRSAIGINSPIKTQTSKDTDGKEISFGAKAGYEYDVPLVVENALGFVEGNTVMYLTAEGIQVTNWNTLPGTDNYGDPASYDSALLTLAGVDFSTNTLTIAVPQQTPAVLAPAFPVGGTIYQTSGGIVDDPAYIGFDTQTGVADDVAKRLVWLNAGRGACADFLSTRTIPHLEIAGPNSQGTIVTANSRGEDLLTQVSNICLSGGINFKITQENKQFLFDTFVGADLSLDGNLIFSKDLGNLKEYTYSYGPPVANMVWGCGPTTGPMKEMLPSGNIQSINDYGRWESWISNVQAVKDATPAEIAASMVAANNLALAKSVVNAQLTMTIQETDQVRYPRDFNIGDKVGIIIGKRKPKQVNEIITTLMYSIPGGTGAGQGSALTAALTKQETRDMMRQKANWRLLQQMSMA